MYAAILAAQDRRATGYVLMAATPRWGDWFLPFWTIADDRLDYLAALRRLDPIEQVPRAAPARLLFQFARNDFFIAGMTGLELSRAASQPSELKAYDAEHHLNDEARADRRRFLDEVLMLSG